MPETMTADQTIRFVVRRGFRLGKVEAAVVVKEFERLYRKHGSVSPENLLEAAANPKNPLHGFFEWEDGAAAHKYRLQQAGYIMRSVAIEVVVAPTAPAQAVTVNVQHKALLNVDDDEGVQGFYPRAVVLTDEELRARHMVSLWRQVYGFRNELAEFECFAEVVRAMDCAEALIGEAVPA